MFQTTDPGKPRSMSRRYGGSPVATVISIITDVAALILILWILMWAFDANRSNDLVNWVHNTASWLGGWAHDLFSVHAGWPRTLLDYALPAAVYLLIGQAVTGRINRA